MITESVVGKSAIDWEVEQERCALEELKIVIGFVAKSTEDWLVIVSACAY